MKTHQSVIYSSLLTFFIFIICVFVFKIQYEANDDRIMQLILNGTLTNGTPDYHSVFNNVIFGFLVSKLYEIIPVSYTHLDVYKRQILKLIMK